MGQVDFRSDVRHLAAPASEVFAFFSDLNNLQKLMPEQVINWQSTEEECSFDIKGMAHIVLVREEVVPDQMVKIRSGDGNPIDLGITTKFERIDDTATSVQITLTADLSPMLKLLASGPLQNLVNIMAEKMTSVF